MIFGLGLIKLLLHFFTNTNYNLHRDEFLYFEEGQHLSWGFFETPPFTPFLGWIADLLGGSVFAIRLFPALAGAIIVILACKLARDLGGGKWAILFTGIALIFSPSLLGSNTLFQPVSFNQLFWFLSAYVLIKLVKNDIATNWYVFGICIGLGFLTKYSILFYLFSLVVAIMISNIRKMLWSKYFLYAYVIAMLISLPNILWQFNHDLPVVQHMQELKDTQLIYVDWPHFLESQIRFHFAFSLVWIVGIYGLFSNSSFKKFRFIGIAFFLTLIIIGFLQGKAYYTLGAFLILFPFGGVTLENIIKNSAIRIATIAVMLTFSLPVLPFSFPILKVEQLKSYIGYLDSNLDIKYKLRWEDDKYYDLPQDIADMHGWEEMVRKVSRIYHSLSKSQKSNCMIYGGSYAHASAINYYRGKFDLPLAYSFVGSHIFWVEEDLNFDTQIMIDDQIQESSKWFSNMIIMDSIQNPNAREKGYIYLRSNPKIDVNKAWKGLVTEEKEKVGIK